MRFFNDTEYFSKTFKGADLQGQTISGIEFDQCTFVECNFMQATFDKCSFVDCQFLQCNLSIGRINYSKFSDVTLRDSKAIGIDWTKAIWSQLALGSAINFHNSVVSDSSFFGLTLQDMTMERCVAHNIDFASGDFSGANFTYSDFSGCIFSDTNLTKANFGDAVNFDIDIFNNKLKAAKFDRFEALRLLASLDIELLD